MSDDATQHVPDAFSGVWHALKNKGYAVTSDQSIGLPDKFRPNFRGAYFNDWTLRHDAGDLPVDRLRARDVIRYQWHDERLSLGRHDAITITDRGGIAGQREHARVERTMTGLFDHYLADPEAIPALDPGADHTQRVTDYIAGMTDRYCIARFTDLAIPEAARF